MNWTLFWALLICFGLIIGNLMMLKHFSKAKLNLPEELNKKLPSSQAPEQQKQNSSSEPESED